MTIVTCSSDHLTDFVIVKGIPGSNNWMFDLPNPGAGVLLAFILCVAVGILICFGYFLYKRRKDKYNFYFIH